MFLEFSRENATDDINFVDVTENLTRIDKKIKGEAAARVFVEQFLKIKGVKQDRPGLKGCGDVRRELIAELRERSNLSIK